MFFTQINLLFCYKFFRCIMSEYQKNVSAVSESRRNVKKSKEQSKDSPIANTCDLPNDLPTVQKNAQQVGSNRSKEEIVKSMFKKGKPTKKEVLKCKLILREIEEEINEMPVEALKIASVVDKRRGKNGSEEYKVNFKDKTDGWIVSDLIPKHQINEYKAKIIRSEYFEKHGKQRSTHFKHCSVIGEVLGITEHEGSMFCLVVHTDSGEAGFVPYDVVKQRAANKLVEYYEKEYLKILPGCKSED